MAGNATIDAGEASCMDAMRKPDGTYRTYAEMVAEGIPTKYTGHYDQFNIGLDPGLDPNTGKGEPTPAYMYGVNLAQVEVDVATGKTQVLRFTWVGDVGVIGNMLSVEGQGYGGISHSIGFALSENYDAEDKHGNMIGCGIPHDRDDPRRLQPDLPSRPRARPALTARAAAPRSSRLQPHGRDQRHQQRLRRARLRAAGHPDKVKAGWEAKQRGEDLTPPKYFLGTDFEEELELIKANPV